MEKNPTEVTLALFAFIASLAIMTPVFLHLVVNKYVTYMTYRPHDNIYMAVTYSLFLLEKKVII